MAGAAAVLRGGSRRVPLASLGTRVRACAYAHAWRVARVVQLRATRPRRLVRPRRPRELLDADLHQLAAPGTAPACLVACLPGRRVDRDRAHTPESSFEHKIDGIRQAIAERGIDYPLAVDNDYEVWSAFDNRHWPALYFVY